MGWPLTSVDMGAWHPRGSSCPSFRLRTDIAVTGHGSQCIDCNRFAEALRARRTNRRPLWFTLGRALPSQGRD
jgi:hypothetical protein